MSHKNKLRQIREKEGLRVTELSKLSGVSTKTIERLEAGVKRVSPVTKNKVVKGLNKNAERERTYRFLEVFPNEHR